MEYCVIDQNIDCYQNGEMVFLTFAEYRLPLAHPLKIAKTRQYFEISVTEVFYLLLDFSTSDTTFAPFLPKPAHMLHRFPEVAPVMITIFFLNYAFSFSTQDKE